MDKGGESRIMVNRGQHLTKTLFAKFESAALWIWFHFSWEKQHSKKFGYVFQKSLHIHSLVLFYCKNVLMEWKLQHCTSKFSSSCKSSLKVTLLLWPVLTSSYCVESLWNVYNLYYLFFSKITSNYESSSSDSLESYAFYSW